MPAQTIIDIGSHYDGGGVREATSDVRRLDESLNKVEGSGNRLVTQLERPIGRIAYSGLAESALTAAGANAKLDGVMGTLHQTFHVLGSSLLFINPELGFLALGAAAIITVFEKLTHATADSAENISKNVEIQRKLKSEYNDSSELLLRHGLITKAQSAILKDSANETEESINKIKESVKSRVEGLRRAWEEEKSLGEHRRKLGVDDTNLIADAYKKYKDALSTSIGLLGEAKHAEDEKVKSVEHHYKALGELAEAQAKVMTQEKERRDFAGIDKKILTDMISSQDEIVRVTQQLNNTKMDSDRAELQAHIEYLNKRIAADRTILSAEKAIIQQRATDFKKYDMLIADEWLKSNHNMLKVAEMFGAEVIKSTADIYATKLEIAAAADIFMNPGLGLLELAAAATIRTIGGGLASDLSGNQVSTNASGPSTLGAGSGGGGSSSGSGNSPNQMNLNVTISGGIPDPHSIKYIMNAISEQVQQFNGVVVASVVKPKVGQVAGT